MIIYDPKTQKKKTMFVDDYFRWLKEHGDTIRILPIRRDGYTPLIEVYKNKTKVGMHGVKISQDEAAAINSLLPKQRKDGYFLINRKRG